MLIHPSDKVDPKYYANPVSKYTNPPSRGFAKRQAFWANITKTHHIASHIFNPLSFRLLAVHYPVPILQNPLQEKNTSVFYPNLVKNCVHRRVGWHSITSACQDSSILTRRAESIRVNESWALQHIRRKLSTKVTFFHGRETFPSRKRVVCVCVLDYIGKATCHITYTARCSRHVWTLIYVHILFTNTQGMIVHFERNNK